MSITGEDRGGNGRNGDGTWTPIAGGCPVCGAVRGGGHGGGCPNQAYVYAADGSCIGRTEVWRQIEEQERAVGIMRKLAES